ncbi:hypothetical protein RIR_jg27697.t1 [Rhizophagus irregularis DAOM 181602=DAOM 197198]|nr:hypothetical protein RIR_jg27697.t1 [Rhizophagus irregularis DAOM 181602=DAOM 197198]
MPRTWKDFNKNKRWFTAELGLAGIKERHNGKHIKKLKINDKLVVITNVQEKRNGKLGGKAMELGAWTMKPNHKVVKEVDKKKSMSLMGLVKTSKDQEVNKDLSVNDVTKFNYYAPLPYNRAFSQITLWII